MFEVPAGGRRYRALEILVKRKRFAKDGPVPCVVKDYSGANPFRLAACANPGLANVAATLCNLLGYQAPAIYEPSLIRIGD